MLNSTMLAYMLHTLVFAAILRGPSERGGVCTPQEGAAMLVDILQAKHRRFHGAAAHPANPEAVVHGRAVLARPSGHEVAQRSATSAAIPRGPSLRGATTHLPACSAILRGPSVRGAHTSSWVLAAIPRGPSLRGVVRSVVLAAILRGSSVRGGSCSFQSGSAWSVHTLRAFVSAAILRGSSVRGGACAPQTGAAALAHT